MEKPPLLNANSESQNSSCNLIHDDFLFVASKYLTFQNLCCCKERKKVAAVFRYNNHHFYIKNNKGDLMGVLVNKFTSVLSTL